MQEHFLAPLLFVVNDVLTFKTAHSFAVSSGTSLPFCNRVGNTADIESADVQAVQNFFTSIPYRWFIDSTHAESIKVLENVGFTFKVAFPAMHMQLVDLPIYSDCKNIAVRQIFSDADRALWIDVVRASYGIQSPEFTLFIKLLAQHVSPYVADWYIAELDGVPVAASMTIRHADIVALHWVGTVPEHRNRGYGYAVTHKALADAHQHGCMNAVLFTSTLGRSVYERIGFAEYAVYNTYGLD